MKRGLNMIDTSILLLMTILLAVFLSFAGNRWIDKLYADFSAILTFPQDIAPRSLLRHKGLAFLLGVLFSLTTLRHPGILPLQLYFLFAFEYLLLLYTFTDFEQQVIFDNMLLPFPLLGGIYTTLMGMPIFDHALAAATGGIVFLLISILTHGGIGGGDIKLIASLGLWLGTDALLSITITGLILGGIAALLLLVTGKKKRNEYFAYGPYFTIVTILLTVY